MVSTSEGGKQVLEIVSAPVFMVASRLHMSQRAIAWIDFLFLEDAAKLYAIIVQVVNGLKRALW